MPRKPPSGPKEGSEFGYDSAADMRAKMRDLFDRDTDGCGDLKQIGKAVNAPTMSPIRRRLLDTSTEIRTDEPDELTFCHSVLCQTSLPSAKPKDGILTWERRQGRATLLVEAGKVLQPKEGTFVQLGLPYGPKARLLLMHLNSEAIRNQLPVIPVEDTMTAFFRRLIPMIGAANPALQGGDRPPWRVRAEVLLALTLDVLFDDLQRCAAAGSLQGSRAGAAGG